LQQGRTGDWDRYSAVAVTDATAQIACRFLSALPSILPSPKVGLAPDGEVSFDWLAGKGRVFSVSLRGDGRLSYAGTFSPGMVVHGSEIFGVAIPEGVIEGVRRLGVQA
jgi:hypothetical protein